MIFIVSTCGDIPKEELIELQKRTVPIKIR